MNIEALFQELKNKQSDINMHMQTLRDYASKVNRVTEFGTRYGDSTISFMAAALNGSPKTIISYDLKKQDRISEFEKFEFYKFIEQDTLQCEIAETDILFIDTLHRYYQLYNELVKHSTKVKQYIILHDTITYGKTDEPLYHPQADVKFSEKVVTTDKQGLFQATKDFFNTEDGKNWKELITYNFNNGLTILERK